jgi:hypothetical protein
LNPAKKSPFAFAPGFLLGLGLIFNPSGVRADWDDLPRLIPGRVRAENALWIENPLGARFNSAKRVTVAELQGPSVITMIHPWHRAKRSAG